MLPKSSTASVNTPSLTDIAENLTLHALILRIRRAAIDLLATHTQLAKCGPLETIFLRVLRDSPKDTETIRSLIALDMATFSTVARHLRKLGFLESRSGTNDKRRKFYALTSAGLEAEALATEAAHVTEQYLLESLAPRDKALFIRLLTKVTLAHAVRGAVQQDPRITEVLDRGIEPGTLLRRALQISAQFFDQARGNCRFSPLEAAAMKSIAAFQPLAVKDLPRVLLIDRGSAFAIVRTLKEEGYLLESSHKRRILELSAAGKRSFAELSLVLEAAEANFLDGLSALERPRLVRVMRKLAMNIVKAQG